MCFYAQVPITLLLADDAVFIRSAIKCLLEPQTEITLVGEATTFPQVLAMCAELKPNVVLLDLHMPGELDSQLVKAKLLDCAKSVLAMCAWSDGQSRALASLYGAKTLLDKGHLSRELVPAIMAAAR